MNNSRLMQLVGLTLLVIILTAACAKPQPSPTPIPPTATAIQLPIKTLPSARAAITLVHDAESDRLIMFGGQSGSYELETSFNDETWIYDVAANEWTQMNPASAPSKRSGSGLAYDAESDRVILFGGLAFNIFGLSDTWAYDYNTDTWKEMAKGPANHLGARLAYDTESDRIILFGGLNMETFRYVNETWTFDFNSNTWTEMKPKTSPPGRNFQAITYDSKADRVLVWGGLDENEEKPVDESMWAYDFNTNTWNEMKPDNKTHPSGRDFTQMVYNAKADRTILYGGTRGGTETWAFDYNTNAWIKLAPAVNPGGIEEHSLVYSNSMDCVILFGGFLNSTEKPSGETWSYDFNTNIWMNVTPEL